MNIVAQKLYEIAQDQKGLFTTAQAIASGYPKNNHTYHVNAGNWKRVVRGVYRLSLFPEEEKENLMTIYLWSRDKSESPQACFSHNTALELYNLSDINPFDIHISVPKKFRNKVHDYFGSLMLHKRVIEDIETQELDGLKVTTPLQTLIDVIDDNTIDHKLIKQAVNQAYEQGMVTITQFKKHPDLKKYLRGKNDF
ncbi:MAG: type IV toxin-antitoxin system AbiEi family antitoxin domain-containing protein [Bacteriovoracaceae bacterium]|nr:type IV toxin-antitoxin system AbiEi family antitoxin domain-containing protein [Bacteriovoracaceae bacterium]